MSNQEMFKRVVLTIEPWGDEFIVRMQTVHADGKVGMISQTGIIKYSEAGPAAMNWARELHRTFKVPVEIRKTVLMKIVETDHVTKVDDDGPRIQQTGRVTESGGDANGSGHECAECAVEAENRDAGGKEAGGVDGRQQLVHEGDEEVEGVGEGRHIVPAQQGNETFTSDPKER